MKIERTEVIWLESQSRYTARELANLSGLPIELLHDLTECGALPASSQPGDARFEAECIALVRAARRLRDDFELDINGLAVALSLLRRMHTLEAELAEARARGRFDS